MRKLLRSSQNTSSNPQNQQATPQAGSLEVSSTPREALPLVPPAPPELSVPPEPMTQQPVAQETQRPRAQTAGPPSGGTQIRHGQFNITGREGLKKYVMVPEGEPLTKTAWDQIFKAWKMKSPNLLIWIKSGTNHPSKIVGEQLSKTKQFQDLLGIVNESFGNGEKTVGAGGAENPSPEALEVVNRVLWNKLRTVMDGICNAADETNSWLLIVGPPAQGEVLLEDALGRSNATPIILVVDQLTHSKFQTNEYSKAMTAELDRLAVPLGGPAKTVAELSGDLWDPEVNKKEPPGAAAEGHRHFQEMAKKTGEPFGSWDFDSPSDPRAHGHPWFSFPYRSGSHYIFFHNAKDMETADLALAARLPSLGPLGYVFLGGGKNTLVEVKNAVVKATPSVLLKNTGRVTQQWAICFDALKDALKASQKGSEKITLDATQLLQAVRDGYDETALEESDRLAYPHAVEVLDVFKSRPEVFTDTIAVVDPLEDSPEEVLNALSLCFSSSATGIVELGVGAAEEEVILDAWRRHAHIHYNAKRKKRTSDALMFISLLLTFLSTAMAVVITAVNTQEEWRAAIPDHYRNIMETLCLIFPALSGVVATVISRLRLAAKWSTLQVAAGRIVSEIYYFRTSTAHYNPSKFGRAAEDKEDEEEGATNADNAGMLRREARMRFVQRVQQLGKQVGSSDMKSDALMPATNNPQMFRRKSQQLLLHVEENVVQAKLPSQASSESPTYLLLPADSGTDFDDFVSPLSTETYIQYRMRPLLDRFQAATPWLSTQLIFTDVMILVLATVGTLLAALELREWIPVSVAMGTVLNALLHYLSLQPRLEATNASITEVENLLTYWSGVGMVDKRMPGIKEHMVQTLERTLIAEIAARAPVAALVETSAESDGESAASAPSKGKKER